MISLQDAIETKLKEFGKNLYTSTFAKVTKVDNNKVDCECLITNMNDDGSYVDFPKFLEVPLVFPGSDSTNINVLVKEGTIGVLFFASSQTYKWNSARTEKHKATNTSRICLSNTFFMPITVNINMSKALRIDSGEGLIAIVNKESSLKNEFDKLYDLLSRFLSQIESLCQTAAPQNPMSGSAFGSMYPEIMKISQDLDTSQKNVTKIFTGD